MLSKAAISQKFANEYYFKQKILSQNNFGTL